MKNSKKKAISLILVFLIITVLFISCGASSDSKGNYAENQYPGDYSTETPSKNNSLNEEQSNGTTERKLIRKVNLNIQTKDFDSFISSVNTGIETYKGYIENSTIDGDNSNSRTRYARMIIRIPAESTDIFISSFPSENSNIVSRQESATDITLDYVDTESRLSSLKAQKQALEALYEKAESISDITYVQKELSSVISEIEAYESTLRELSSLVSYSTVTLEITEVEVYTQPEELTYTEQISSGFTKSLKNVGIFFRSLSVFFIVNLPYLSILALFAGIAITVYLIVRRIQKKNRSKKEN